MSKDTDTHEPDLDSLASNIEANPRLIPETRPGFVSECAAATSQGSGRRRNEDAYLCALPTLAVADGVGGGKAGHLASWLAVGALVGGGGGDPVDELLRAFEEANSAIRVLGGAEAYAGAATTLTALRFVPGGAWIAHLGDSRAYRVRAGRLEHLTTDHSLVAELRRSGAINAEQARRHPLRSVITRCLGMGQDARPDLLRVELEPSDTVVLCSDGLVETVSDEQTVSSMVTGPTLSASIEHLIWLAQRCGTDDVTIAAARVSAA